jgi:hypothetical protein
LPLLIVSLIIVPRLLGHCFQPFFNRWRPQWTKPFVQEEKEDFSHSDEDSSDDEAPKPNKHARSLLWTIFLTIFAALATAAETVKLLKVSEMRLHAIFLVAGWSLLAILLVFCRPRYCPPLLLAFYVPALVADLAAIETWSFPISLQSATSYTAAFFGIVSIGLILWMPLRPISPLSGPISGANTPPKNTERSPEDALRLWQFLSVSWVWPLLAVGKERQMEKDDVWMLGYGFQNGRLARAFREVRGSTVFKRLLKANGIDCCILTFVGLFCSKFQMFSSC